MFEKEHKAIQEIPSAPQICSIDLMGASVTIMATRLLGEPKQSTVCSNQVGLLVSAFAASIRRFNLPWIVNHLRSGT